MSSLLTSITRQKHTKPRNLARQKIKNKIKGEGGKPERRKTEMQLARDTRNHSVCTLGAEERQSKGQFCCPTKGGREMAQIFSALGSQSPQKGQL